MAKLTGHSVPPSMASLFARSVRVSSPYNRADKIARGDDDLIGAPPWETSNRQLVKARTTGDWFAEQYASAMSATARRDFRAARIAEIMAGVFPVAYWETVPLVGTDAQLIIPTSVAAPGVVPPEWQDPMRQASSVNYYTGATTYAVPAAYTDAAQKSPGWFGDVQGTVFADRWAAQLRYSFDVASPSSGVARRPMWAKVWTRHELSASFRGNRFWASANFSVAKTSNFASTAPLHNEWRGALSRDNAYRLPVASPAAPWVDSIERWHTVDLISQTQLSRKPIIDKFFLWAAPATPKGRYFSRNDWCRCWFFAAPAVYLAKAPA